MSMQLLGTLIAAAVLVPLVVGIAFKIYVERSTQHSVLAGDELSQATAQELAKSYGFLPEESILALVMTRRAWRDDERVVITDRRVVADQRRQRKVIRLSDVNGRAIPYCRDDVNTHELSTRERKRIEIVTYSPEHCRKLRAILDTAYENRLRPNADSLVLPRSEKKAAQSSINWLWLLPIGLFLMGAAFGVASVVAYTKSVRQAETYLRVPGTVTSYRSDYDSDANQDVYYPRVEFLTHEERTVSFVSTLGRGGKPYEIGATVSVLYDPRNPSRAVIDSFAERYFVPIVCAVLALGAFGFCIITLMAVRDSG
jgi:hypothetical protein